MIVSGRARICATLLLLSAAFAGSLAHASSLVDDQDKAVETVRQMFVALANDDADLFRSVTSADFYSFEVGKRFEGDELLQVVRKAHAAGRVYVWTVMDPEVRVDGDTALVTYVNRGSVKDATGVKELSWLESAVLRRDKDVWRIHFFHSTRVPPE